MTFSLLAVTTDRLHLTERLFHSLASQRYKDFEVLFIYGEARAADALALARRFGGRLNIQPLASPSRAVSSARNLALPLAKGDCIAFPDDDCVYPPDVLHTVSAIFAAHPEADALLAAKVDLDMWEMRKEGPRTGADGVSRVENRYAAFTNSETYLQFYRKKCTEAVGGFDETLGPGTSLSYGSGEDTDYVLRVLEAGFGIFRAPGVVIAHPALNPRNPEILPRTRAYAAGRMRVLHKHSMPLWFVLANIAYPLLRMPVDCLPVLRYRWNMFGARLAAGMKNRITAGR
jgi:GT2 family glycosyltransferase